MVLPNCPTPEAQAGTVIQRDVAPTEAGVIYEVGADASDPVHGVVDWHRPKTVPEQFVRIRRGVVLEGGEYGPATRRMLPFHVGSHLHGMIRHYWRIFSVKRQKKLSEEPHPS